MGVNKIYNVYQAGKQIAKTVASPITHARNVISSTFRKKPKFDKKEEVSKYRKEALKLTKENTAKAGKEAKKAESKIGKDAAKKIGNETKSKMVKDFLKYNRDLKAKGGRAGFNRGSKNPVGKKKNKFPDHSGDGEITQKDILMAKGVIPKPKSKKKVI